MGETVTIKLNGKFYRALFLPDGTAMIRRYLTEDAADNSFDAERLIGAQETAAILCRWAEHEGSFA